MRTTSTRWLSVLTLACAGLWSSGSQARAEDPVERTASTWRFDIRVLRVTSSYATVEQAPTLPGMTSFGVTAATWAELLAALKARGSTQIVMDRNVTALPDRPFSVVQSWTKNVLMPTRSTGVVSERVASPVSSGVDVRLTFNAATGLLEYALDLRWTDVPQQVEPVSSATSWTGTQSLAGDGTLVLRHADQERAPSGGTEVYVLISWDTP
jgi:hypothetical protein